MYKEIFPSRLTAARKDTGFTLRDVEKELNIHFSTLSNYESGKRQPDLETLGKLAEYYGVSIDWLLGIERKKTRNGE